MGATSERMVSVIEEYCRAETEKDKAAWIGLFAPDATHEDPVGSGTVNRGLAQLEEFWTSIEAFGVELWLDAPPIVCGREAVALMHCAAGPVESRFESGQIVDHFVFDDDGKIESVRAFWSF